jgi:hypothetical protein
LTQVTTWRRTQRERSLPPRLRTRFHCPAALHPPVGAILLHSATKETNRPSPDSRALTLHLTRCDRARSQAVCPFKPALALTVLLGAARHRTIRLTLHSRGRPRCPTHAHFLNACGSPALHLLYSSSILAPRLACLTTTFFPRSLEASYNRSLNRQICCQRT